MKKKKKNPQQLGNATGYPFCTMYIREGHNLHGLHKSNLLMMLTLNDFSFLPAGQQVFFYFIFYKGKIEGGRNVKGQRTCWKGSQWVIDYCIQLHIYTRCVSVYLWMLDKNILEWSKKAYTKTSELFVRLCAGQPIHQDSIRKPMGGGGERRGGCTIFLIQFDNPTMKRKRVKKRREFR